MEALLAAAAECCVPCSEDRELGLHRVGVDFAPRILAHAMVHSFMRAEDSQGAVGCDNHQCIGLQRLLVEGFEDFAEHGSEDPSARGISLKIPFALPPPHSGRLSEECEPRSRSKLLFFNAMGLKKSRLLLPFSKLAMQDFQI